MPFPEFEYNNPYTNDAGSIAKKKQGIVKTSRQKKDQLDPTWNTGIFNDARLNDADGYAGNRLGTNQPDISFDALETSNFRYSPTNKDGTPKSKEQLERAARSFRNQQLLVAERTGMDPDQVTIDDIKILGEEDANKASDILFEGQENFFTDGTTEGPVRPNQSESGMPIIETRDTGKLAGGRPVKEFRNPITGKSLLQALNTPDTNVNYHGEYNKAGRDAYDQTPKGKERILENTDRTAGEVAKDITAGVAKFGVNSGAALYGLGDLSTQDSDLKNLTNLEIAKALVNPVGFLAKQAVKTGKNIGESLFGKPQFAETNKLIDEALLSDQTKLSQKKLANQMAKHDEGSEARKEKWIEDKKFTPLGAEIMDLGLGILKGAEAGIDNPLALQDILVTSAPQLLTGGIFGRAAVSKAITAKTANMTKKEASAYIASAQGKKLVDGVATRTGIATEAIQESMINAVHKQEDVMNMSHDDLMKTSEQYQSNIARGMDQEAAKQDVANKVFNTTAAITAVISSGASKLTGTGKATGKLFVADTTTAGGKAKTALVKAAKTGDKILGEGVQETFQEGGSKFAENVAEKLYVDENKSLSEGVGTSAGLGALAGVATAGGIHTAVDTAKAVKGTGKLSVKGVKKVVEKGQAKAKEYVESKQDKVIVDPKAEGYNPDDALDVTIKKGTRDTTIDEFESNVTIHAKEALDNVKEEIQKVDTELQDNKADPNLLAKRKRFVEKRTEIVKSVREQMQLIANQKTNDSVIRTTTTPAEASDTDIKVTSAAIKTSDRFGNEQLDAIIANKDMPAPVVESAKLRKTFNETKELFDSQRVQGEVLTNKEKNNYGRKSIEGFKTSFDSAIQSGDIKKARDLYKKMTTWRNHHASKLAKLKSMKPGQTIKYKESNKTPSFKFFDNEKGHLAYNKLLNNVQLENEYMDSYLALMAKSGQEAAGKVAKELDTESLDLGVSQEVVDANLEYTEAPLNESEDPTPNIDTITPPTTTQEAAEAAVVPEIVETKEDLVSKPVKEKEPEKVEATTDTEVVNNDQSSTMLKHFTKVADNLNKDSETKKINAIKDTIQQVADKGQLSQEDANKLLEKIDENTINTIDDIVLDADLEIAQYEIFGESGNMVAKNLGELVKLAQDRMNAVNSLKECL